MEIRKEFIERAKRIQESEEVSESILLGCFYLVGCYRLKYNDETSKQTFSKGC